MPTSAPPAPTGSTLPLAVDMDGTLIADDVSYASYRRLMLRRPWLLVASGFWLLRGLAHLKTRMADRHVPDPTELPYHADTIAWLRAERAAGHRPEIVLCSASEVRIVRAVADHVGLFDDVMGTDGPPNLRRQAKRDALDARFGKGGYAYAGNSHHDEPVWEHAGEIIAVNCSNAVLQRLGDRPALILDGLEGPFDPSHSADDAAE